MQQTRRRGIVVVGQIGRDLVLRVDALPESGGSTAVSERIERLGGKGANQAIALRQLGADVALIGVAGHDAAGDQVLADAVRSGLDVRSVRRRGRTALLVDVVEPDGTRRLLEDVPREALATPDDVRAAAEAIRAADTVSLQLQQPPDALVAAARIAVEGGARIVLDGAIDGPAREELLGVAEVVRADATEAAILTGMEIRGRQDAAEAAERVLACGPSLVALAVPGEGDLVAWRGGARFFPHRVREEADPTGAGDAFVAGLIVGFRRNGDPEEAGRLAAEAAASTVLRLGGRPDLSSLRSGGVAGA